MGNPEVVWFKSHPRYFFKMKIVYLVFITVLVYFFLMFVIPFLFFPGFLRDVKIQKTNKLVGIAEKFRTKEKEKTLKNVFNYVEKTYADSRGYKLFILLNRHFYTNVENLINKKQYLPCHVQSLILKTLLINTGQFQEGDFKKKITIMPLGIIHRYGLIKVGNKKFKADPYFNILKEIKE